MLSPLPRRSDWDHSCSFSQPYQPSPKWRSGRPAQRPFRGLLSVHSRYGLHTRAATIFEARFTGGFNHFVTSTVAPVASGWSRLPGGICTHWESAALTRRTPQAAIQNDRKGRLCRDKVRNRQQQSSMSAVLDFEMCTILPGWVLWSSRSQRRSGIQLIRKDINNNDIWLA